MASEVDSAEAGTGKARRAAGARARLAVRAERAWGLAGLEGVIRSEPPVPPLAAAREVNRSSSIVPPPRGHDARASADPPAPVHSPAADLFGTAASAKPIARAAADPPFADPPLPRGRRIELLTAMDDNEVKGCTRCPLHATRTSTVFGEGDPEARLMFVGEGPGETEDQTGRPFVGKAGAKLNDMIGAMGLTREQVYIANVVKCRPPNNRVPTTLEVDTCTPYLHRQIEWVRPQVIVTLGLPATRHLVRSTLSMGRLRGQWSEWRGIRVMPTYHPAYLLRSYTDANRRAVWGDLQLVMSELGLDRNPRQ